MPGLIDRFCSLFPRCQVVARLAFTVVMSIAMASPPVQAAADKPVAKGASQTFNLGHQFPRDSIPDQTAQKFAALVAEKSQGKVAINVHPAAAFGDEREHIALLRRGGLDFAITGDLIISSLGEQYLVLNLPFLYRDPAHALAAYGGKLGEEMRTAMTERGLLALSWHYVGTRMLTANRPVRNLAELAGLNLRLPQDTTWIAAWRALGAQPRQVQFTDLPLALKLGQVDAQENPPNFIRSSKLYESQKYLMTTNHMPQRQFLFGSSVVVRKLPVAQRKLLEDAAAEASRFAVEMANRQHQVDLDWLVNDGGMTLIKFDAAGVDAALQDLPRVLAGQQGQALYQQIKKLR